MTSRPAFTDHRTGGSWATAWAGHLGWGSDVHRYATFDELRHAFPSRLATGPRVLKPRRGNGGIGVWKVELADAADTATNPTVLVQGAAVRDTQVEEVTLDDVVERCAPQFAHDGGVIDQAFQPRVTEGMTRCYLVADRVVGFARQSADSLLGEPGGATRIMGIPCRPSVVRPARFAHTEGLGMSNPSITSPSPSRYTTTVLP